MRLVVITPPQPADHEARIIGQLIDHGVWAVHLRRPGATALQMSRLIEAIPVCYHRRLVLHDHHELCSIYGLKGVHLNRRNPLPPAGHQGSLSASTHSLTELAQVLPKVDYAFLSPVFDSISKQGYTSAFTAEELLQASHQRLIGRRVLALGGVTADRLDEVRRLGFGGAALLGDVWRHAAQPDFDTYLRQLQQSISCSEAEEAGE